MKLELCMAKDEPSRAPFVKHGKETKERRGQEKRGQPAMKLALHYVY